MDRIALKEYIKDNLLTKLGHLSIPRIKKLDNKIRELIFKFSNNCKSDVLSERVYWVINDYIEYPKKCTECAGPITRYTSIVVGYPNDTCCRKCGALSGSRTMQTNNREKTGYAFVSQMPYVKEKKRLKAEKNGGMGLANPKSMKKANKTYKDKTGYECPLSNPEVHVKSKATKLERYGDENYKDEGARKTTCNERYGEDHYSKTNQYKDGMKIHNQNVHGVDHYYQSADFINKAIITWNENMGVDNPFQSEDVKSKIKNTQVERRGVEYYLQTDEVKLARRVKWFYMRFDDIISKCPVIPRFDHVSYIGKDINQKYLCTDCNKEFEDHIDDGSYPICNHCNPKVHGASKVEKELCSFVESIYDGLVLQNKRSIMTSNKRLELDVYLPDVRIAFEFNGLHFHSYEEMESPEQKLRHLIKTEYCIQENIMLVHVNEDEWKYQQVIVKSRIRQIVKSQINTIFARKCVVKIVDNTEHRNFLNENHIQGFVGAKVKLGLYYEDRLVSLMSFGKTRFNKKYEYELLRFCNVLNTNIPGAASKLFMHFIRNYNPESIISYADRRWSQGNLYNNLGFDLINATYPNYKYFKSMKKLYSRVQFQKHKLKDKLEIFDPDMTEAENVFNNGYRRIWDCGNLVFAWIKENG